MKFISWNVNGLQATAPPGHTHMLYFRYALPLRYCTDYAFYSSMLDETVETRLPWRGSP